jgi:hypothetical protein
LTSKSKRDVRAGRYPKNLGHLAEQRHAEGRRRGRFLGYKNHSPVSKRLAWARAKAAEHFGLP